MSDASTKSSRRIDVPMADSSLIGETRKSSRGYFVRVSRIFFEKGGMRTRVTLLQEVGGVTEYLHHLDLTMPLVRELIPLLKKAIEP
jgi:hypothetical protein